MFRRGKQTKVQGYAPGIAPNSGIAQAASIGEVDLASVLAQGCIYNALL